MEFVIIIIISFVLFFTVSWSIHSYFKKRSEIRRLEYKLKKQEKKLIAINNGTYNTDDVSS